MRLADRAALVTGAGRGIGRAIALQLASEGARVAVNFSRSELQAGEVVDEIIRQGGHAFAVAADVSDGQQVADMVRTVVERLGRLDILVNNAGITRDRLLLRMTDEDWDAVLDTNLKGAFHCIRSAAAQMLKQRSGAIVNVGSIIGRCGQAGQANYAASKAGLIGLTRSAARELGSRAIRVNAVAPGYVETDMTAALKPEQRDTLLGQVALARLGRVEDVARVVSFLCSDDSAYIQGEVIAVDGGLFM